MKTLILLVAGISLSALSYNTQTFEQQLLEAEAYCRQLTPEADRVAAQYQLTATEILPIVYPECARYSALSNKAEATVLEYYYIEGGTAAADFSVGHFQMKPGFAEALEQRLLTEEKLSSFRAQFSYTPTEVKAVREERLNRLLDQTWQLHYLCLFYKIMLLDHGDRLTDAQERTAFFCCGLQLRLYPRTVSHRHVAQHHRFSERQRRGWQLQLCRSGSSVEPKNAQR